MYTLLTPKAHRYNRLEGRPRTVDFDRTLRAEIADPLWMLTRQWQFGEFKGEDTGSSIFAKMNVRSAKLTHFTGHNTDSIEDVTTNLPQEAQIEGLRPRFDLKMSMQLARYWKRTLQSKGLISLYTQFKSSFPLQAASASLNDAEIQSNGSVKSLMNTIANKGMDGVAFYRMIKDMNVLAGDLIGPTTVADHSALGAAGIEFIHWVEELYVMPDVKNNSWVDDRLEYSFSTGVEQGDGYVDALHSEEHYSGVLNWYDFEIDPDTSAFVKLNKGSNGGEIKNFSTTAIPTQNGFPGMPASRWWEFEDGTVNYGNMDLNEYDIGQLLLAQFGLMYSNDWSMVPLRLPKGSLSNVTGIVVTDVFGQRTLVEGAGSKELDDTTHKWGMFNLSTTDMDGGPAQLSDSRLFVPAKPARILESDPVESVKFMRDEMSNMVWGIEKIIPDGLGKGRDGKQAGQAMKNYLAQGVSEPTQVKSGLKYELVASDVSENWIPFVPVKVAEGSVDQIRLQRGKLKRKINGKIHGEIMPRTDLLSTEDSEGVYKPLFLREEEIPKSGIEVKTTYQRVRWYNGKIVLWLGRSKELSQSDGPSRLTFDTLKT